jgi:hypothetical protein
MGWLRKAVHCFDRAAQLSQPKRSDAILRWNACVRVLQRFDRGQEQVEKYFPRCRQRLRRRRSPVSRALAI